MLDKIKNLVAENRGIKHVFRFNGIRNQNEEFIGKIVGVYPAIFTVELPNKVIKSFSYTDLLINNLEIMEWLFFLYITIKILQFNIVYYKIYL